MPRVLDFDEGLAAKTPVVAPTPRLLYPHAPHRDRSFVGRMQRTINNVLPPLIQISDSRKCLLLLVFSRPCDEFTKCKANSGWLHKYHLGVHLNLKETLVSQFF